MATYPGFKNFAKGIDNRLDAHTLPPDALRDSVNFDLDDAGNLRRRPGRTALYSGAIAKGTLFAHGDLVGFVEGGDLKQYHPDGSVTVLRAGVGDTPLCTLEVLGAVYFTNGQVTGKLVRVGPTWRAVPWGLDVPVFQPTVTAIGSGSLAAGAYQVAITYADAEGAESGAGLAVTATVAQDGGLRLTDFPAALPKGAVEINVYVSEPNGQALYQAAVLRAPATELELRRLTLGRPLATQFCQPPMPATSLAFFNGRIYLAEGDVVWTTRPFAYDLTRPEEDFYPIGAPVSLLAAVDDGVYIAADRTYFLTNASTLDNSDRLVLIEVLPYGAIPGTVAYPPDRSIAAWWSARGLVLAGPQGKVENVTEARIAHGPLSRGTMLYREQNGLRQFVACLQGEAGAPLAASTS